MQALESLVGNLNQQTERENRVVGELEKLHNLNRLDILKLSQVIMNDPMKVKLLFNLDEDLNVEWIKTTSSNPMNFHVASLLIYYF